MFKISRPVLPARWNGPTARSPENAPRESTRGANAHPSPRHPFSVANVGVYASERDRQVHAPHPVFTGDGLGSTIQLKRKSLRGRVIAKIKRGEELSAREQRYADQWSESSLAKLQHANTTGTKAPLTAGERVLAPAQSRSPAAGFQTALTNEIARRQQRRAAEGRDDARDIRAGDRPDKPTALSQKAGKADLTAHHLLPYNKIRDQFADAVEHQDLTAMQNILSFAGRASSDSSEAYRALAYQRPHAPKTSRSEMSAEEREARKRQAIYEKGLGVAPFHKTPAPASSREGKKELFKAAAWASHNVFMGPAPQHRRDDPKEGLDARYLRSGHLSASSVMAREIYQKGFSGIDPVHFSRRLQSARNQAEGLAPQVRSGVDPATDTAFGPKQGGVRRYDPADWTPTAPHAQVGAEVRRRDRRYQKWAGKNNWQKVRQLGMITKEEEEQRRGELAAARARRRQ
jgi:hypothetical protein